MTDFTIPSSPADQKKLRDMVEEYSKTLLRISSEKALQKDIKDRAKEELAIPPGVLAWMSKQHTDNTFDEVVSTEEQKHTLFETVMRTNQNDDTDED